MVGTVTKWLADAEEQIKDFTQNIDEIEGYGSCDDF